MKIQLLSDLHLEFHQDGGRAFIDSLDPTGVDVLILAGDICLGHSLEFVLGRFCEKYPVVVFVLGNHEYYKSNREDVRAEIGEAVLQNDGLYWLDNSSFEMDGVRFVGGTMWFREAPSAPKEAMNDFVLIEDFESWVYQENADCIEQLKRFIEPGSVVVTHYLPSYRSVHPKYAGSNLNAFFVCDVEQELLVGKEPALWLHGHTHESMDYRVGKTRVVCNPFGYLRREENRACNERLIIEV